MPIDVQNFLDFSLSLPEEKEFSYAFKQAAENLLPHLFQESFLEKTNEEKQNFLENQTPLIYFSDIENDHIQIIALCRKRDSVVGFFYEMISRYLLPYKPISRLSSLSFPSKFIFLGIL